MPSISMNLMRFGFSFTVLAGTTGGCGSSGSSGAAPANDAAATDVTPQDTAQQDATPNDTATDAGLADTSGAAVDAVQDAANSTKPANLHPNCSAAYDFACTGACKDKNIGLDAYCEWAKQNKCDLCASSLVAFQNLAA